MKAETRAYVLIISVALYLCLGPATARQAWDPFALPIPRVSHAPRYLSHKERAEIIRRETVQRAIEEARQAARSRRGWFHGLYPGWQVVLIDRV